MPQLPEPRTQLARYLRRAAGSEARRACRAGRTELGLRARHALLFVRQRRDESRTFQALYAAAGVRLEARAPSGSFSVELPAGGRKHRSAARHRARTWPDRARARTAVRDLSRALAQRSVCGRVGLRSGSSDAGALRRHGLRLRRLLVVCVFATGRDLLHASPHGQDRQPSILRRERLVRLHQRSRTVRKHARTPGPCASPFFSRMARARSARSKDNCQFERPDPVGNGRASV